MVIMDWKFKNLNKLEKKCREFIDKSIRSQVKSDFLGIFSQKGLTLDFQPLIQNFQHFLISNSP